MPVIIAPSTEGQHLFGSVCLNAGLISLNSANTDFVVPVILPAAATRWRFGSMHLYASDGDVSTGTIGCYTAAAAGGVALITAGTAIAVNTATAGASLSSQSIGAIANVYFTTAGTPNIYVRVGTAVAGKNVRCALFITTYP